VLHLDDDPMPLSLFKRAFERRGYRVTAYADPRAALDALRANPAAFDLVVTDYNMPDLSGLDVARQVRAINAGLAAAVLSDFIDETLGAQAADAGIRELIPKATPVASICETVERLVQASRVKSGTSSRAAAPAGLSRSKHADKYFLKSNT
jgi:two-component system, cell cycle sensor histidine kinase and response regulator CckA